jgi:hypothetical protein
MSNASIWIIGDWRRAEFSNAVGWLQSHAPCKRFDHPANALCALRSFDQHCDPTALVLVQARPGQFTDREVERLHAVAPLALLVALVGPWCEGEARSGHPWPGVMRVPWRSWQSHFPRELALNGDVAAARARLARTASDIEHLESSSGNLDCLRQFFATAAVCTESRTTFESIADALALFGIDSTFAYESPSSSVDLVIIDGWEHSVPSRQSAAGSVATSPPRVLFAHFPREIDFARAADMGIAAVVAQPLVLADLAATLVRILPACRQLPGSRTLTSAPGRK